MASFLNEELMKTNLDIPDGEIEIMGVADPVYADAINVHNKKKKATEKALKDKNPELKKPFLGTKGATAATPKTKDMKKLRLSEDMFKSVREHYDDAPEQYQDIFRIVDNMEHIIDYISDLSDEDMTYEDMAQSYDVLEDSLREFRDNLDKIKGNGAKNDNIKKTPPKKESVGNAAWNALGDRNAKWADKDRKNNRDTWSCIYNELNGEIKDVEASYRRFDRKPKERYKDASLSFDGETIIVNANTAEELAFARQVAQEYGVQFEIVENTSRWASHRFSIRIHTDRPSSDEL